jgi:hypothetical protein
MHPHQHGGMPFALEHIPASGAYHHSDVRSHALAQTKVFEQKGYLENFVQSTFNALPADEYQGECPHTSASTLDIAAQPIT